MNIKHMIFPLSLVLLCVNNIVYAEEKNASTTIYQVMQRVLNRYPSLKIAEIEITKAFQQKRQIESSLGWVLNSSVGAIHDLTGFGTPSDRLEIKSSLNRQLKSGADISFSGSYQYEDNSFSFSPILPNPAHRTRLDLSYRIPLSQGMGNPIYQEGLTSATLDRDLAEANLLLVRISLAEKVSDLFHSFALTELRIINAKKAVSLTKKLSLFINKNMKLGLSEEKDKLQIEAQLNSKLADLSVIKIQRNQIRNSLNRLMLDEFGKLIQTELNITSNIKTPNMDELILITEKYHPSIKIAQTKLDIAQSQINTTKDIKKDNLDLVMSVGTRTSNGNSTNGTVSEQDWAGAVSIEYKHLFDNNGVSSKYQQALFEKHIAQQNFTQTKDDVRYAVFGLIEEINFAKVAVKSSLQRLKSESRKLKEAEHRFHSGRADTAQLIQFQNEYLIANLSYQNQKVELNKRVIGLQIVSGEFWDALPVKHEVSK